MASSKKEVAKSIKTLIVMLQSLRDQQVTITLRNDTLVRGTILRVDACMNVELKDAVVEIDKFYCTQTTSSEQEPNKSGLSDKDQKEDHVRTEKSDVILGTTDSQTSTSDIPDNVCPSKQQQQPVPSGNLVDKNNQEEEVNDVRMRGASALTHQCATVYNYFIVKGTRIRHIDLPTDCDLVDSTKVEIERIRSRRKQWSKKDIVRPTVVQ